MPTAIQVHNCGTEVIIDREAGTAGTIGTRYRWEQAPTETYWLDEAWVKPYTLCRVCGKELDDTTLAFAYWHLERGVCSTDCLQRETLKRYACCDQATPLPCVCAYATTCPIHGDRHVGTHD